MDMILNLLKHLAATLSPTEFLLVLALLAVVTITVVKFFLKHAQKKGGIGGLVGALTGADNPDEDRTLLALDFLSKKTEDQAQAHTDSHNKIIEVIKQIYAENKEHDLAFKEQITEILLLKKDLEGSLLNLSRQLQDLQHQLKMHESHEQQTLEAFKELIHRTHDILNRIASQLEKVDEFARAAVPEFRSYHKELSKEVGELSRDIALVERSIQAQINTVNAVKLR